MTHRKWIRHQAPISIPGEALVSLAHDQSAPLLVYCHGMGEDPQSFSRFWPEVNNLPCHVVAPAGPYAHEVRKGGTIRIGHAWYLYDGGHDLFAKTARQSWNWLLSVLRELEEQHRLSPSSRVLMGYSQGAYFSFAAALNHQNTFHGLIAAAGNLKEHVAGDALQTGGPLHSLILHGEDDPSVPVRFARESASLLRRHGYRAELIIQSGGHGLHPQRDAAAAEWLRWLWNLQES